MQKMNRDRTNGNKQTIHAASIFVNWIKMYKPGYYKLYSVLVI